MQRMCTSENQAHQAAALLFARLEGCTSWCLRGANSPSGNSDTSGMRLDMKLESSATTETLWTRQRKTLRETTCNDGTQQYTAMQMLFYATKRRQRHNVVILGGVALMGGDGQLQWKSWQMPGFLYQAGPRHFGARIPGGKNSAWDHGTLMWQPTL